MSSPAFRVGFRAAQSAAWSVSTCALSCVLAFELVKRTDPHFFIKVVLLVLAAGCAVVSLSRPHVAMYAVPFLAANAMPMHLGGLSFTAADVGLVLFLPAFVRFLASAPRSRLPHAVLASAVLVVVGSALASTVAASPAVALWGSARWILLLVFFAATRKYLVDADHRRRLSLAVWTVALGVEVVAFGARQASGHYIWVGPPFDVTRVDSTFGYYTNYANFVGLALIVGLGLFMSYPVLSGRSRLVGLAGVPLLGYGLVEALSRGALLELAGGALALAAFRLRRPKRLLGALLTGGIGFGTVVLLLPAAKLAELQQRFSTSSGSDSVRYQLQAAGRNLLSQHPLGIGYGNFQERVADGNAGNAPERALAHAHNVYLTLGLDAGWLGLLGFVALLLSCLGPGLREGLRSQGRGPASWFAAALVGYLLQGWIDYFFFETASFVLFGVLLAGSSAVSCVRQIEDQQRKRNVMLKSSTLARS